MSGNFVRLEVLLLYPNPPCSPPPHPCVESITNDAAFLRLEARLAWRMEPLLAQPTPSRPAVSFLRQAFCSRRDESLLAKAEAGWRPPPSLTQMSFVWKKRPTSCTGSFFPFVPMPVKVAHWAPKQPRSIKWAATCLSAHRCGCGGGRVGGGAHDWSCYHLARRCF